MLVADGAHPVRRPARVLPASLAHLQPARPAVGAPVDDAPQLNPAPPARPVRVGAGAVPVRRGAERSLAPQALQLRFEAPGTDRPTGLGEREIRGSIGRLRGGRGANYRTGSMGMGRKGNCSRGCVEGVGWLWGGLGF